MQVTEIERIKVTLNSDKVLTDDLILIRFQPKNRF